MSKLLHIQSSPRGKRSSSIAVAEHFITAYCAAHPNDTVETLNVWEMNLPEFDGSSVEAKYAAMHQQSPTPDQIEAWDEVKRIANHFMSADKYLFSMPMWNFSIPYKLKHLIDVLVQPGITVSITEAGPQGVITGKPTVAIYSRAFALGPGTGLEKSDFQVPYLHQILGFIGMTDIRDIIVEPTEGGPTAKDDAVAAGKLKAAELALTL